MNKQQVLRRIAVRAAVLTWLGAMTLSSHAKEADVTTWVAAHFQQTAIVKEDTAAGISTVSTEPGYVQRSGLMRMVWSDEYLQGVIDRRSGEKSYAVVVLVVYSGDFRSYDNAEFSTAAGKHRVATTLLKKQVDNCAVGECTYSERVAFAIDDASLRQLAAEGAADKPSLWPFKLVAHRGNAYLGTLSTAEIAGFLARVDEVSAAPPLPSLPVKTLLPDFGIEGIAVAAGADSSNRAGVLIAAVKSGSVAQKAGLIIGDIVSEIDGHSLATLPQLQGAVAAVMPGSTHPLRLYRGLTSMTLTLQF